MSFIMKKSAYNVLNITHTKNYTSQTSFINEVFYFILIYFFAGKFGINGFWTKKSVAPTLEPGVIGSGRTVGNVIESFLVSNNGILSKVLLPPGTGFI